MHTFHFCDSDPHVHTLIITGSPCASQLQVRVSELEAGLDPDAHARAVTDAEARIHRLPGAADRR